MTLDDLIDAIHKSGSDEVKVERLKHVTGNSDGSGNYSIVKVTVGSTVYVFSNESGVWAAV